MENNKTITSKTGCSSRKRKKERKIFHRNSSGARTLTSNSKRNRGALKEHRLARRRQRRQQETEEQGIRGIMIVLHCRKPSFLSLPASPLIYRSKSAKFQLYITARRIIIFRRTAPGHICSFFFFSFSKSGRRNNAKSAFQYTVNNNAT